MKLTFITLFSLFFVAFVLCNAQRVITSSGTCVRDGDCKEGSEFCDDKAQCRNLLKEGEECPFSSRCGNGLFCAAVNERQVCVKQKGLSEKCSAPLGPSEHPCSANGKISYKCSILSKTCGLFGREGDPCISASDCQLGNYCMDTDSLDRGHCAAKKSKGELCNVLSQDGLGTISSPYECEGICAVGNSNDFDEGFCTTPSSIGQPCTSDSHCAGYDLSLFDPNTPGTPNVICNIPKDDSGICLNVRDLIKREGMKCNPSKDACDFQRGLSCMQTPTGSKCMFNAFDKDIASSNFCNINAKFSNCNIRDGRPTECRRDYNPQFQFEQFFECRTATETVPQGSLCGNVDYSVCAPGTSCKAIPGVSSESSPDGSRFCVSIKQEGEKCFSKFITACADGLKCDGNICVKGTPSQTGTHASLYNDCEQNPCVPGTECVSQFGFQACELKTVVKSEGACFSTALTQTTCSNGTICSQNENGSGVLKCREKFGVGAVCSSDEACKPPLKCGGIYPYRKCYDPILNRLGQKCNPNGPSSGKGCVVADDGSPMDCLPKGKAYACQKLAALYERCGGGKNVACSPRSMSICNGDGVCVPKV